MDELDPAAEIDTLLPLGREPVFRLARDDMRDDYAWVEMLVSLGLLRWIPGKFAWGRDLGLEPEEMERMQHIQSVLVRKGHGAYLDPRRVKPEVWSYITSVLDNPDLMAFGVGLAARPTLAESIVAALLEDDEDVKDEINSLFEVDLMPLREELKKKFRLTSVVIHTVKGAFMPNYAEIHFCVAREGTSAWSGAEANDIRTFIWTELSKYTDVKRRKEIEIEIRVEPKKLKGQWPYMRMIFQVVFEKDVPQFLGVDST